MNNLDNLLSLIVGIMSIFVVFYRIIKIMIPMLLQGIKDKNIYRIMTSFTQLV